MQMNLTKLLPLCQDSYLGNIYLSIETYMRRSRVGHGCPAAGTAPPDKGQRLACRAGQAAHDHTGLRSPVRKPAPAARAMPVPHPDSPSGRIIDRRADDHVAAPDRRFAFRVILRSVTGLLPPSRDAKAVSAWIT